MFQKYLQKEMFNLFSGQLNLELKDLQHISFNRQL